MKKISFFLFSILAVACMSSCERKCIIENTAEGGIEPIRFTTGGGALDYGITTRSDINSMKEHGFGVFGYNTGSEAFNVDSPSEPVIDNYKLTSADGKNWVYDGAVAFWNTSSSDKYTFLAYHPYDESRNTLSLDVPTGSAISDCIDYIVAKPVIDQVTKNGVTLDFEHIFSKINVVVKLSASYENQIYTLKGIMFSDVMEYPSYSLVTGFDMSSATPHDIVSKESDINNPVLTAASDRVTTVDPIFVSPYDYGTRGESFDVTFVFDYEFINSEGISTVNTLTRKVAVGKDLVKNKEYNMNVTFTPDKECGIDVTVSLDDYTEKEELNYEVEQTETILLSDGGVANSYVVSKEGYYKILAAYNDDGNVNIVGPIASAEVLWESYGTDEPIASGNLVANVVSAGDYILFKASDRKGNALIAAKDADGKVLWSWHIWLTDQPVDQVYNNGAGLVMDRNLGATSAQKEDGVRTHGVFYQWGRKDPFPASGTLSGDAVAANTGIWPEAFKNPSEEDMYAYVTANPMTFVLRDPDASKDCGWMPDQDNTRWNSPEGRKTANDPCPYGYRVAAGGDTGLWATALGTTISINIKDLWDDVNKGNDLSGKLTEEQPCWYPVTGYIDCESGSLTSVGSSGFIWGQDMYLSPANNIYDGQIFFSNKQSVSAVNRMSTSCGIPVRCVRDTNL